MTRRAGAGAFADIDSMLADLLCLPTEKHPERESRRGKLSRRVVSGAAEFVESSGVLAEVERWVAEDHPDRETKGRRPTAYDDRFRLFLTILFALVFAGEDPLISRISEAVTSRLHTDSRDLLGLPPREDGSDVAVYHRVYRALRAFVALVDSAPGTTGRRMTRAQVEAIKAARDPAECAKKHQRLLWLSTQLLDATAKALPEDALAAWEGNIAFEATLVKVWGKKGSPVIPKEDRKTKRGTATPRKKQRDVSQDRMSPEFQAGWYHRDEEDHADTSAIHGKRSATSVWGYEAHLATMVANTPGEAPSSLCSPLASALTAPPDGSPRTPSMSSGLSSTVATPPAGSSPTALTSRTRKPRNCSCRCAPSATDSSATTATTNSASGDSSLARSPPAAACAHPDTCCTNKNSMVAASNLRKINAWLKKRSEPIEPPAPTPRGRKKATNGLQSHRPPANAPPYAIPA